MNTERNIGEVFELNGVKYRCVRYNLSKCRTCCFSNDKSLCLKQRCVSFQREDGEEVAFEEVKD